MGHLEGPPTHVSLGPLGKLVGWIETVDSKEIRQFTVCQDAHHVFFFFPFLKDKPETHPVAISMLKSSNE